jgi:hypothetical protein
MSDTYVERREIVKTLVQERNYCEACLLWIMFDIARNANDSLVYTPNKVMFDLSRKANDSLVYTPNKTRDIHEIVNRSQGGSIIDLRNLLAVCRPCHNRITTDPKNAERLGLHLESWCNNEDGFKEAERVRYEWSQGNIAKPHWFSAD